MRALIAIAGVVVMSVVGVAAQQAPRPAPAPKKPAAVSPAAAGAPPAGPLLAGQVFKNVQVLKDVPVDDFLPPMGVMTASVGGDCSTCHAAAGTDLVVWEADTPLKRRARQMSAMV